MQIFLEHLKGERAGTVETFGDSEVIRVGRSSEYELCFDDLGVSYDHAELRVRNGALWLVDRGSTNGSYINGQKAYNSKIRVADVLKFGKHGPELRLHDKPVSARAAALAPSRPSAPSSPALARPTDAIQIHGSELEAGPAVEELGQRYEGSARLRLDVLVSLLLFVLAAGVGVFLGLRLMEVEERLHGVQLEADEKRITHKAENQRLLDAKSRLEMDLASERRESEDWRNKFERIEIKSRRQSKDWDAERQRAVELRRNGEQRIRRLQTELALSAKRGAGAGTLPDRVVFQRIQKRFNESTVIVVNQITGHRKNGKRVDLTGSGTGFFITKQGHIITNKHVVQPWLFRSMAEQLARDEIELDPSSHRISVWVAGSRYMDPKTRRLNLRSAFSTISGTLKIHTRAPDLFETFSIKDSKGIRRIKAHKGRSNNDIVILKVTAPGPFQPLIPHTGNDAPIQKLDPCMVLGFPAGGSILESGKAETSPSLGTIRKVEDSIWVQCSMHPGNSGGPVFDREGRCIGIATRIIRGSENIGSCIKVEHALKLLGGTW